LLGFTYATPIALLAWFIARTAYNVPLADDWSLVDLFQKVAAGTAGLSDFFALHNEHRMFFPRILFVVFAFTTGWNVKVQMFFSFTLGLITFWTYYQIAARNRTSPRYFHLFNILTAVYVFSVRQWNWLWGFQIAWYLINLCVAIAVYVLTVPRQASPNRRWGIAAVICAIASFSSAQGLFSWLALLPAVLYLEGKLRWKIGRTIAWLLLFGGCYALYMTGDTSEIAQGAKLAAVLQNPEAALQYLLALAGTPIGSYPSFIGAILITAFLLLNLLSLWRWRTRFALEACPWLCLGWFAMLFMLASTMGRFGYGIDLAKSGHYIGVTTLLVVAYLQLWRLALNHDGASWRESYQSLGSYFLAGVLLSCLYPPVQATIKNGRYFNLQLRASNTCVHIAPYLESNYDGLKSPVPDASPRNCLQHLSSNPPALRQAIQQARDLNLRQIPDRVAFVEQPLSPWGAIEQPKPKQQPIVLTQNQSVTLVGWASAPTAAQQPDVVLFSYGDRQSFFADATVKIDRPGIAKSKRASRTQVGWQTDADLSSLPLGETTIQAWIYHEALNQFHRLPGEVKVKIIN
jgi:hypothetical protein